jgi:RND family efflux transporter MFP subunit
VRRRVRPSWLLIASLAAFASGCERKAGEAEQPAPEVVVVPVQQRDVDVYQEWVGTTTGYVNAQIYPKIQGYLLKQTYRNGATVKAGELLFQIDPRQFQALYDEAKGQLGRAQAALGKSELDVKRYTPLAAQGAVSQQELDDAIQARAANTAQVASAKASLEQARLNLEWTEVRSPIDGIAGIAKAQVGDLVSPTTLLASVSQVDPIKVTVQVSEIDYLRFAKRVRALEENGGKGGTPLELILADGTRYPETGHVEAAGLAVQTTTGTLEIQGVFPNPKNLLRPGQYAMVRAVTDRLPGALVIPQRAVSDMQGVSMVAVVGTDDKVDLRRVTVGPQTGSDFVITKGLAAGDRVVAEGIQKVRQGEVVKPVSPQAPAAEPAAPAAAGS